MMTRTKKQTPNQQEFAYFGTNTGPCLMERRTERIVVGSALRSRRQT